MKKLALLFIVLTIGTVCSFDINMIPESHRGGLMYSKLLKEHEALTANSKISWGSLYMPVDHEDKSPTRRMFIQRYVKDTTYFKPESMGPVIFYISGENTMTKSPVGFIQKLAEVSNGLIVALEHRFYGESIPDMDLSVENLKYLTVKQSNDDSHEFIQYIKKDIEKSFNYTPKFFHLGGSYAGALASWFNMDYPDDTVGGISSSGVVNAILDFKDFDRVITFAAGTKCADALTKAHAAVEHELEAGPEKSRAMKARYNVPDMEDVDFLFMVADGAAMVIQYGENKLLCDKMTDPATLVSNETMITALVAVTKQYWGEHFGEGCFYDTECLKNHRKYMLETHSRSWRWQCCDEVAYFNNAPEENSIRSKRIDLNYHLQQCKKVFGEIPAPRTDKINERYGAEKPHAHRIMYFNARDDPWRAASVTKEVSDDQPYIYADCFGCAHCRDLKADRVDDPPELKQARIDEMKYFKRWMGIE